MNAFYSDMEIRIVNDCSISVMHDKTKFGPEALTIICRDCACVIIAEQREHLLVVSEIVRD